MTLKHYADTLFTTILRFSCFIKCIPFNYNKEKVQLERASKLGYTLFSFTALVSAWNCVFLAFRLQQISRMKNVPPRILVMNFVWMSAYALSFICKLQCILSGEDVRFMANWLLAVRRKDAELAKNTNIAHGKAKLKEIVVKAHPNVVTTNHKEVPAIAIHDTVQTTDPTTVVNNGVDWLSLALIIGIVSALTNPLPHALVLLDMPCAPQYTSSLFFNCSWMGDLPMTQIELIPFVFWENFVAYDVLSQWSFFWCLLFLSANWIKDDLIRKANPLKIWSTSDNFDYLEAVKPYRMAQIYTCLLNDAFKLYLQYFTSLLFMIAGLVIFGTIRFSHLPFHIFAVFPACAFRCLYEAVTQLEAAASVNAVSGEYLEQLGLDTKYIKDIKGRRYMRAFKKSCKKLTCNAGSMFTLEKTIVPVCVCNCFDLTFNFLIAYPDSEEFGWGSRFSGQGSKSGLEEIGGGAVPIDSSSIGNGVGGNTWYE